MVILPGTACAAFSYNLSSISNPPVIYTGDYTKVSFSIKSTNYLYDGLCAYRLDNGLLSNEFTVGPGQAVTKSINVRAPLEGSGSGSVEHTVYTYCYESAYPGDPAKIYRNTSFNLSYDDSRYRANTAINSAQSAIDSAKSIINNSRYVVTDAGTNGADVTLAENNLSNADKLFRTSQTKLSFANSFFGSGEYDQAAAIANESKVSADLAKIDADNAYLNAVIANQSKEVEKSIQQSGEETKSDVTGANMSGENEPLPGETEQKSVLPSFEAIAAFAGLFMAYSGFTRDRKYNGKK
ncbi:MAG: hypothetical protein FIB08_17050 [Candidatus Methanoperedens sp.]|nr:hypothetical protein [Candidatus Methanoperedens sp.]